jgi:hypothetical protein
MPGVHDPGSRSPVKRQVHWGQRWVILAYLAQFVISAMIK